MLKVSAKSNIKFCQFQWHGFWISICKIKDKVLAKDETPINLYLKRIQRKLEI